VIQSDSVHNKPFNPTDKSVSLQLFLRPVNETLYLKEKNMNGQEYAGFWIRTGAGIIDTILMLIIIIPVMTAIYGDTYWDADIFYLGIWDALFNYILPAIAVILFWFYKSATPGKMALKLTIVDANTGQKPSIKQLIIRYLGYYLSSIPLLLGIIWVGIDKRKQGWHDKLANTVVIINNKTEAVKFEG
jgi:uncharacterized RDD family membrane protein YckC